MSHARSPQKRTIPTVMGAQAHHAMSCQYILTPFPRSSSSVPPAGRGDVGRHPAARCGELPIHHAEVSQSGLRVAPVNRW